MLRSSTLYFCWSARRHGLRVLNQNLRAPLSPVSSKSIIRAARNGCMADAREDRRQNPLGSFEKKWFYFYSSDWRIAQGTVGFSQINGDNMLALKFSSAQRCFEYKTNQPLKKVYRRVKRNVYSHPAHMRGKKRKILSVADSKLGLYKDINHCTHSFRYDGCLYFTTYILNALNHWKRCIKCLHVL